MSSSSTSALEALSAQEAAAVLEELLAARPDLRDLAEEYAQARLSTEDRTVVAGDVADALRGLEAMPRSLS
jgi:hypothetical protein